MLLGMCSLSVWYLGQAMPLSLSLSVGQSTFGLGGHARGLVFLAWVYVAMSIVGLAF